MAIKITINTEPTMKIIDTFYKAKIKYEKALNKKLEEEYYMKSGIDNHEFPNTLKRSLNNYD